MYWFSYAAQPNKTSGLQKCVLKKQSKNVPKAIPGFQWFRFNTDDIERMKGYNNLL